MPLLFKFIFSYGVILILQKEEKLWVLQCGKTNENGLIKSLISVEELKTLKLFEAIILMPRIMPIKTMLLSHEELKKYFN